ncbi:RNA polymerase sigma factor [Comamonas sp. SY3]|uniref:RNA polymerase sigma factor n=1 Tax=Comamonas sp. SY3 TaxID=3243601 RepID=UPI0035932F96
MRPDLLPHGEAGAPEPAGGHLASLYQRWRTPVMRMLRRHFGNAADVEDATQEVFARVAATGKVLQPDEEQPYLRKTLQSVAARDWQQSAQARGLELVSGDEHPQAMEAQLHSSADDVNQQAAQQQRLHRLHQAIQELPERQRQAFVLHRVEGHTVQQTAEQMGISMRMVVKHLARAVAYCETRVQFASAQQMQQLQAQQLALSAADEEPPL